MSRYVTTVPACIVTRAFAGEGIVLPLEEEIVTLFFGYDPPLDFYFLDVEEVEDEWDKYHEFGCGGFFYVPGTRLSREKMLNVLDAIVDDGSSLAGESNLVDLTRFRDAIVMDLPM